MNTEQLQQLRAEFEAWAKADGYEDFERFGEGYSHPELREAWRGYLAGRAALQSQATEAFPCRIIEVDFEAGTVTLEMHGKYTVSIGQKYLCDAPLQSQDREDDPLQPAANWLIQAIENCGVTDIQSGLRIAYNRAQRLFDHARRIEGDGNG